MGLFNSRSNLAWEIPLLAGLALPAAYAAEPVKTDSGTDTLISSSVDSSHETCVLLLKEMISIQRGSASNAEKLESLTPLFDQLSTVVNSSQDITLSQLNEIHGTFISRVAHFLHSYTGIEAFDNFYKDRLIPFYATLIDKAQFAAEDPRIDRSELISNIRSSIFAGQYKPNLDAVWASAVDLQSEIASAFGEYESFGKLKIPLDINSGQGWMTRRLCIKDRNKINHAARRLSESISSDAVSIESQEVQDYLDVVAKLDSLTCADICEDARDDTAAALIDVIKKDLLQPLKASLPLVLSQNAGFNLSETAEGYYEANSLIQRAHACYDILYRYFRSDPCFGYEYLSDARRHLNSDSLNDKERILLYRHIAYLVPLEELESEISSIFRQGLIKETSPVVVSAGLGPLLGRFLVHEYAAQNNQFVGQDQLSFPALIEELGDPVPAFGLSSRLTERQALIYQCFRNALYDYSTDELFGGREITRENFEEYYNLRRNNLLAAVGSLPFLLPEGYDYTEAHIARGFVRGVFYFIPSWPDYSLPYPDKKQEAERLQFLQLFSEKLSGFHGELFTVPSIVDHITAVFLTNEAISHKLEKVQSLNEESFEKLKPYFGSFSIKDDNSNIFLNTCQSIRAALYSKKYRNIPDLSEKHDEQIDRFGFELADAQREYLVSEFLFSQFVERRQVIKSFSSESGTSHLKQLAYFLEKIGLTKSHVRLRLKLEKLLDKSETAQVEIENWRNEARKKYQTALENYKLDLRR